jgi:hypothetical protein
MVRDGLMEELAVEDPAEKPRQAFRPLHLHQQLQAERDQELMFQQQQQLHLEQQQQLFMGPDGVMYTQAPTSYPPLAPWFVTQQQVQPMQPSAALPPHIAALATRQAAAEAQARATIAAAVAARQAVAPGPQAYGVVGVEDVAGQVEGPGAKWQAWREGGHGLVPARVSPRRLMDKSPRANVFAGVSAAATTQVCAAATAVVAWMLGSVLLRLPMWLGRVALFLLLSRR